MTHSARIRHGGSQRIPSADVLSSERLAFAAAALLFPQKGKTRLLYTTTSPKLHKVLGVETPVFD